ncbi:MAG: hypothetical protein KAU16_01790 [Methanophagales archaeon]|nr:hypothetical protein [Methanophagales archaeon]
MREYRIAIFDPRIRINVLEELIYPSIFYSSWRTEEEKIRAMYRHKIRIGKSIGGIGDAEEKEELYNSLDELYLNYIALFGFPSVDVKKREAEVEAEVKNIEAKAYISVYGPSESPEEVPVSTSTKWIKARVGMLLAQVMKIPYIQEVYARGEFATLERDLSSLERKLFEEPDSQAKADVFEEIEKVRELLLLVSE